MRVYMDTEFIEDGRTIDLLSIGMVREDGATFYAVSSEADHSKASPWVQENVLPYLDRPPELRLTRAVIREKILTFLGWETQRDRQERVTGRLHTLEFFRDMEVNPFELVRPDHKIELWGWYSAYDHVALCQLWGPMIDLPKGMPMFTHDLKQLAEELGDPKIPKQANGAHNALADAEWVRMAHLFLIGAARQRDSDRIKGILDGAAPERQRGTR